MADSAGRTRKASKIRAWLVAPLVGAVLLAGACGDGSGESSGQQAENRSPSQVVATSASRTVEAKSSRMTFTVDIKGSQQIPGGSFTSSGDGVFDYANRQGSLTMTLPPLGGVNFGRVEAVIVGTTIYQRFPSSFGAALGNKPWVKTELAELDRLAGVEAGTLAQTSINDPSQALDYLRGVADVVEVGKEQIRGDEVTHYRGTIDLAKAADQAPPERQAALRKIAQLAGGQLVPVDVWVDGDGRLRKSVHVMDLGRFDLPEQPGRAPVALSGTMTFTMELFDFGTPVEVEPPPADQVTELAELTNKARSGR